MKTSSVFNWELWGQRGHLGAATAGAVTHALRTLGTIVGRQHSCPHFPQPVCAEGTPESLTSTGCPHIPHAHSPDSGCDPLAALTPILGAER